MHQLSNFVKILGVGQADVRFAVYTEELLKVLAVLLLLIQDVIVDLLSNLKFENVFNSTRENIFSCNQLFHQLC